MLADLLTVLLGLAILVGSGDLLVRGAAALARRVGVSPLAIGLTVVAFGTSAPELAVNLTAAVRGDPELSFGNIFGSNMANIGLIIAATGLFKPLQIHSTIIRREMPMMMLATAVAGVLALDGLFGEGTSQLGRSDGLVLLLLFTVFVYYTLADVIEQREASRNGRAAAEAAVDLLGGRTLELGKSLGLTAGGLVGLALGARLTVAGAVDLAVAFGVSQAIIGLTLVAVGTSLPELTASIMATVRGQADLAIGNAVGSNVFNLLLVMGASATISPVPVPAGGLQDILVTGLLSMLLWLASASANRTIIRAEAALLLGVYLVYIVQRALL
jgi:cation:H+ antiporter